MYYCPICGSEDNVSNGVDGYICCDCSSQFFIRSEVPFDGLADNEIYDPGYRKPVSCPQCECPFFESFDEFHQTYTCICGCVFYRDGSLADDEDDWDLDDDLFGDPWFDIS